MRCYPRETFILAAAANKWRLRDDSTKQFIDGKDIFIAIVPPFGRLVVTRHCNGRAQVQGVSPQKHRDAEQAVHEQLWAARAAAIVSIAQDQGITLEQAERAYEDQWQAEKEGRPVSGQASLAL